MGLEQGDGHHRCGSVRALPSVNPGEVVLQATNENQAVRPLTGGQMTSSRLVPPGLLSVKQLVQSRVRRNQTGKCGRYNRHSRYN